MLWNSRVKLIPIFKLILTRFDIFLDAKLKPWLLEINYRPSLTADTPLDLRIKQGLIKDTLALIKTPSIVKIDMW